MFTAGLLADLLLLLPIGWLSDRLEARVVLTPALLLMAGALAYMFTRFVAGNLSVFLGSGAGVLAIVMTAPGGGISGSSFAWTNAFGKTPRGPARCDPSRRRRARLRR